MIKIKYQNDEAGEDDPDVEDVEVEESWETLDQSYCELEHLRFAQMNLEFFSFLLPLLKPNKGLNFCLGS